MDFKRVILVCGHYGSGKTNLALNIAMHLRNTRNSIALADLDIVNPYFRSADFTQELNKSGIRVIASAYASSGLDIPALPQEMHSITQDMSLTAIVDVGGDDRGALALGHLRNEIIHENNYEMLFTVNMFRPLTCDVPATMEVLREIEQAAGIRCTSIVNNSNLGNDTTIADILSSEDYIRELCNVSGLPLKFNAVKQELVSHPALYGKGLFPIKIYSGI